MKTLVNVLLYLATISFIGAIVARGAGSGGIMPFIPILSSTALLKFVYACLGFAIALILIQIRDK